MLLLYMQEIVPVDFLGGPFVLSRGGGGGGGGGGSRHAGSRLTDPNQISLFA